MNIIRRHIKKIVILLIVLTPFVYTEPTFAVNSTGPDPASPGVYYTVSAGSTNGSGSNLLYAPTIRLKLYSRTNGGFTINIIGGGQCAGSGDSSASVSTTYDLYKANSQEQPINVYAGGRVKHVSNNGRCDTAFGTISISVPNNSTSASEVDGHTTGSGAPLYVYYLYAYIPFATPNGSNGLNVFKVQMDDVIQGPAASDSDPNKSCSDWPSSGCSLEPPIALLGRPSDENITNTYHLDFGVPCDNPEKNPPVRLKWFDADAGTWYQPNSIKFELYEYQPDTNANPTKILTQSGGQLGGEGVYKQYQINLKRGYRYRWIWSGVTNKNGVQVWFPYDSTNFDFFCTPPKDLDANCSLTNTSGAPLVRNEMISGQQYDVQILVANTGNFSWVYNQNIFGTVFTDRLGSGAGANTADPRAARNNTTWQPVSNGNNIVEQGKTRIRVSPYPVEGVNGLASLRLIEFRVTAPIVGSTQTVPFWWQMVREKPNVSGGDPQWFGTACKKNITVKVPQNYPYIQVQGDDVISGANFTSIGVCTLDPKAARANIYTNGFRGDTTAESLDGSSNAQFGTWASGNIGSSADDKNTFRSNYGYVRNPQGTQDSLSDGLFANDAWADPDNEDYGNFYEVAPSSPSLPCLDISADIAGMPPVDISPNAARTFLGSSESGTKVVPDGSIIDTDITVPAGTNKTLLVIGSFTIKRNINFGSSYSTSSDIPSLKIIANNIYIEADAQNIDANLIAFPDITTGTLEKGIIDTCSNMVWQYTDGTPNAPIPGGWPSNGRITTNSCKRNPSSLVINGSVAARRILFKRTNGTLGDASNAADTTCYYRNYSVGADPQLVDGNPFSSVQRYQKCAAELIKFSPESYISQMNTDPSQSLQAVPVSTLELPPIN